MIFFIENKRNYGNPQVPAGFFDSLTVNKYQELRIQLNTHKNFSHIHTQRRIKHILYKIVTILRVRLRA